MKSGDNVYSNLTITSVTATDIYFTHSGGIGNAKLKNLEPEMQKLSDAQLRAKTDEFRQQIAARLDPIEDENQKSAALKEVLDEILPQAFAVDSCCAAA